MHSTQLPIANILDELRAALSGHGCVVLQAPPGAGKTTGVPPALLDCSWLGDRKILMLEPRRIAARAAARRMADMLGDPLGGIVGYRVRLDTKVSRRTRIEVVTEGILVRRLQDDPGLADVGLVIFDEFHERNLDADLGLALCLEAQEVLREDLKILVMSATLDGAAVSKLMGNAPILSSAGRAYPVETRYAAKPLAPRIEPDVARAILSALELDQGSILVFLPGAGEIRHVERLLAAAKLPPHITVAPLYGNLSPAEQDRAIEPSPAGHRKVVLATSIAETSLTIEGIRIVIDSGLMRVPRFDPRSGMSRLDTIAVSEASADQRRGRAGRVEAGICYRLWTPAANRALAPFSNPEIMDADLSGLALELAVWGVGDANSLKWLTPPPPSALQQARELLFELGAIDDLGRATAHGRRISSLPLHPRLAHLVIKAQQLDVLQDGARLAALMEERPILKAESGYPETDIHLQLDILGQVARGVRASSSGAQVDQGLCARILKAAHQIAQSAGGKIQPARYDMTGVLVAFAYPDRIAQRRKGSATDYLLMNGRGAYLNAGDPLATNEFLAVADLDGQSVRSRIYSAAALDRSEIEAHFAALITDAPTVHWDAREEAVISRRQRRLGQIVLKDSGIAAPPEQMMAAVLAGINASSIETLPWTPELRQWQHRILLLKSLFPNDHWPDVTDSGLLATLELWLPPFLAGITRRAHFSRIDLGAALHSLLDWKQAAALERLAPTHVSVPSGSRIAVDYSCGNAPVLAVRLQEMFGATQTPAVADGRMPLTLHLLSPARKPVQITCDLPSFWANTYILVKSDLKGRYPKHYWPDNPLEAEPTARIKRRQPNAQPNAEKK